jgi:hypothetical protein
MIAPVTIRSSLHLLVLELIYFMKILNNSSTYRNKFATGGFVGPVIGHTDLGSLKDVDSGYTNVYFLDAVF